MKICISSVMVEHLAQAISQEHPAAEVITLAPDGTFSAEPDGTDVFCFSVDLALQRESMKAAAALMHQPGLVWVQAPGAGVELPLWTDAMDRGVRLTSAAGVHAEPVAQYIFTQILHWHRQVPRHQQQQADRAWQTVVSDDLTTKTLGIVGLGGIGLAAARIAKAFGMDVVALRRTPGSYPNVDRCLGPDDLHELLNVSDFVALCLPLNDSTRHLIGAAEFAAMGADTVLINVARGPVVNQDELIEALTTHTIAAASLDVTDPEPLPADSPLWALPNCAITPHDAGYSPLAPQRLATLFLENLALFVADAPLRNEVFAA